LTPPADYITGRLCPQSLAGADTTNTDTYAKVLEQAGRVSEIRSHRPWSVCNAAGLVRDYCSVCHGSEAGDGPVVGPIVSACLHTDGARAYRDGTLFQIITAGKGNMSSYANKLEPKDRWAVIYYVRALQRSMHPKPEDLEQ
jgi:hypothetical protein